MKRYRFISLALTLSLLSGGAFAQAGMPTDAQVRKSAQASFPEFFEMLALPNDAIVPGDVRKNADWLERAFIRRGFAVRQLPNDGKPMIFAEFPGRTGAKTVLFYMHFDGQPVLAEQWAQKSPWTAVVKRRNAEGAWEAVGTESLQATPVDPDLRVFARSASDDKGPIMMMLAAMDALKASGLSPDINIKVILDGEEERGSPTLARVAKANAEMLRADGVVVLDGPRHASNRPTIVFGNRGAALATLTVYGPKNPLHSGHYGNYAPNPAMRLAGLLASMKDKTGRVTIPGYYENIVFSEVDRAALSEVDDDDVALRKRIGIAGSDAVADRYLEAMQYPSLNIRGMHSGAIGDKAANIVPDRAVAELDLRTTPEAGPDYLFGLLERHIRREGWHLSAGEPTDAERQQYDKIASFTYGGGSQAARTPMDAPVGVWVYNAMQHTFGNAASARPVRIRMLGGSVPTAELVDALDIPFVIVPLVNGDNNQHGYDENVRVGHYVDGVRLVCGLLRTPFAE